MTQTTGREPDRLGLSRADVPARARIFLRPDAERRLDDVHLPRRTDPLLAGLSRPWVTEFLAVLVSGLVFAWQVGRPSPWWDEAISRDVTSRSASEIVNLTQHIDLVHATYYLLVHAILGSSATITPIRLLSVVAAALTTGLLVQLGRELGSGRVGLTAAALWTAAPLVSRYAQEARPYAMVALAATGATLALVRVCRRPWLRGRWMVYLCTLIAVGLLNVLALLIIVVHLSYVLATSSATVRRRWYLAAGAAGALLAPLLVASSRQSQQVAWLPRPNWDQLTGFLLAEYASGFLVLGVLVIAIAGIGRGTHSPSLGLGLSWALLPPVILWTISQAHPFYDWRYVFFTVPGTALALASLATLLRARWLVAVVLVLAVGGLHMQEVYRRPAYGHGEDIRDVAKAIAANAQPGDAVLFLPSSRRVIERGFPKDFLGVDDVALARTGPQSDSLWGVEEPPGQLAASLHDRNRVWLVTGAERLGEQSSDQADMEKERLLYNNYRQVGITFYRQYQVKLYVRDRAPSVAATSPSS